MPRKPDRKPGSQSPIQDKQRELDLRARQLKARLEQTRAFLEKAPVIKAEVTRRQQRAIFERYTRPSRIEGPADFRLELVTPKGAKPPRRLRKERSKAPIVTVVLLIALSAVVFYVWHVLWQG